jgi:hypothetical protein
MPSSFVTNYKVKAVSRGFASLVAIIAVLGPLRTSLQVKGQAAALLLHTQWQARVIALNAAGWLMAITAESRPENAPNVGGSRKWRMFNCSPLAVYCEPAGSPCHTRTVCPQCWGRDAIEQWSSLDRILFGSPDRPAATRQLVADIALVSRRLSIPVPTLDEAGRKLLPYYLDQRIRPSPFNKTLPDMLPSRDVEFRRLKQAGALGGLEVLRFEPRYIPVPDNPTVMGVSGWTLEARQILVVPTAAVAGFLDHPKVQSSHQAKAPAVAKVTDRLKLAKLVGWAASTPLACSTARRIWSRPPGSTAAHGGSRLASGRALVRRRLQRRRLRA